MGRRRGLKYVSLHEASGYGVSARRYLRALASGPISVTWQPMVAGIVGDRPWTCYTSGPLTARKALWDTIEVLGTLFEELDDDLAGAVSFHLWGHPWWSRWRRDSSLFHAGRLTERSIANADTTCGLAARSFLPEPVGRWERFRWFWREALESLARRVSG